MPYNDNISSADAAALIPEDASKEIIKAATEKSAAMSLFTHRKMSRLQQRLPVLALKPTAYFVNGRTGLKQTADVNWTNVYINAEEIAVIVPIPESLVADVDYPIWDEIKPEIAEAIAVCLDNAIFFGTNIPASWPSAIAVAAAAAGNTVTAGTSAIDVADDINDVMKAVEADGYDVNGFWARQQFKGTLRGLRDAENRFLLQSESNAGAQGRNYSLFNETCRFSKAGLSGFAASAGTNFELICGDWSQGIIGLREDISYKVLDQAVIQDDSGQIIYNLAQQDMVALRCTFRAGFAVPNPVNRMQATAASRYPFGCLLQAS